MANQFAIYVYDARKGSTYMRGLNHGYLTGSNAVQSERLHAETFATLEEATARIASIDAQNTTGVVAGKLTAYVCWSGLRK